MKRFYAFLFVLAISISRFSFAQVIINEIMYHDENSDLEFVELFNTGDEAVDLSGWSIRDSQEDNVFLIPNGTSIRSQDYIVIADDSVLFNQIYDFFPHLDGIPYNFSNAEDSVRLFSPEGTLIEAVVYDDRAPWPDMADGDGSSLERLHFTLPANLPESWAASSPGGTPGSINSVHMDEPFPIIRSIDHQPRVPAPYDDVTVMVSILNTGDNNHNVQLYYGYDGGTRYQTIAMMDDGKHGDGEADDGKYGATIAGSSAGTLLRFYVEVTNRNNLTSLMPEQGGDQPYMTVFENPLRNETVPMLRIVMRPEVHQQFLARYQTDEYFPATFYDGDDVHYHVDIRHRGRSRSQNGRFKIRFPYDQLYRGKIRRLNFNGTDTATILREYLSYQLYQDSGIPNLESELVRFHINGEPTRGTPYRIAIENPDSQFLRRQLYFDDDDGNLYKTTLDGSPQNKATWRYVGDDPDLYRDCYIKQTNESEDDFSDIIHFCKVLNEADPEDADYVEKVKSVLDVDEFLRWMAVSAVVAHWDSPYTDHGHNYVLYNDPDTEQFNIIAWDLNGTFNYSSNHNDLNYRKHYTHIRSTKFPAINKILNHREFGAQYHSEIDHLLNTLFTEEEMERRIDEARDSIRAGNGSVSFLRTYVTNRRRDLAGWINKDEGMAFISKPCYQSTVNELYRYRAVAADYRFQQLVTFRLLEAPGWISIGTDTGMIMGTPTQVGVYPITVEARNSRGLTVIQEYDLQVVDSNPRLIVNFNEDTGAVMDLSPFQHSGNMRGSARREEGQLGNGVSLSGFNAYVEFPHDSSLNLTGSITVEAWIKPDRISDGNPIILTKGGADQFNYNLMLGYGPWSWDDMEPCFMPHRFDINNRVYYGRKEIQAQLHNRQWVHVVGTYDSAAELVRVYSNNFPIVESSSRPQMVANQQPLYIGINSNQSFQGVVDSVRILPFAKQAFASGLCLSQVDVSGISSAQDRIGLSLSEFRGEPIDTGDYCIYLVQSGQWIFLPSVQLEPGESVVWWMDDLGLQNRLSNQETVALYPKDSFHDPSREYVLDQVVWGDNAPNRFDPGVQAAVWLPERSVELMINQPTTLALKDFANNDDMDIDWEANPQQFAGPEITSFRINNGAEQSDDNTVELSINTDRTSPALIMRISNSPNMGEDWQPFSASVTWDVTAGDGLKTVYLQVMDTDGMRSKVATAAIDVDTNTGITEWKVFE